MFVISEFRRELAQIRDAYEQAIAERDHFAHSATARASDDPDHQDLDFEHEADFYSQMEDPYTRGLAQRYAHPRSQAHTQPQKHVATEALPLGSVPTSSQSHTQMDPSDAHPHVRTALAASSLPRQPGAPPLAAWSRVPAVSSPLAVPASFAVPQSHPRVQSAGFVHDRIVPNLPLTADARAKQQRTHQLPLSEALGLDAYASVRVCPCCLIWAALLVCTAWIRAPHRQKHFLESTLQFHHGMSP